MLASIAVWSALQAEVWDRVLEASDRREAAEIAAEETWGEPALVAFAECKEVCTVVIVDDDECGLCVVSQDSVSC